MNGTERMKDEIARRCVHYSGALDTACKLGVVYEKVRRAESWPFLPCVRFKEAPEPPDTCVFRHFPTPAEVDKQHESDLAAVLAHLEKIADGICPQCGKKLDPIKHVGRSVIGACGHRIGSI